MVLHVELLAHLKISKKTNWEHQIQQSYWREPKKKTLNFFSSFYTQQPYSAEHWK
jgi:hypothetical protein